MSRIPLLLPLMLIAACSNPTSPAKQPTPVPETNASAPAPLSAEPPSQAPATPAQPAAASVAGNGLRTDAFGGERWGFVEISSANGRLVVLRRFRGPDKPSFGQHGEVRDTPDLTVFDRFTGSERDIDEIIDINPDRRWLLALDERSLWLVDADSGDWLLVADVDLSSDHNRCLSPRQAAFSITGQHVGWVAGDAQSLTVRNLETGEEWSVAAQGRLWRGWPDDDGRGAILAEVDAQASEWPSQRTSCACRWCNRFAASFGFYGWGGPSFTFHHVAADGTRTAAEPPEIKGVWHDKTSTGCELVPASTEEALERGPWRWQCP